MKVYLDAFDLSYLAMYCERVFVVKSVNKVHSKKYDAKKSEFEALYVGFMGEVALRKVCGGRISTEVYIGGDPTFDTVVGGRTAQVKSNTYQGKNLDFFVDDMSCFNADILVGVQILSPVLCDIVGFIDKDRFIKEAKTKNYGYGDRLSIPASALESITKLL